jgi:hypothetical protein
MTDIRITLSPQFETLIARAGLSKAALAEAAGISRLVIFRALQPKTNEVRSTLRGTTAWKMTRAYAERSGVDRETAFALLFVIERPYHQDATDQAEVDQASTPTPELQSQVAKRVVQPLNEAQLDGIATGPLQTIGVRLDEDTARMLEALMHYEDRSSTSEMMRLLVKRAYRALVARRSATEGTIREAPTTDTA